MNLITALRPLNNEIEKESRLAAQEINEDNLQDRQSSWETVQTKSKKFKFRVSSLFPS